jgi:hypothetical protein
VPTSRDPLAPRADRPGIVLSAAAMAALIYTIIEAPVRGWGSASSIGGFALAAGLFALFIDRERHTPEPMLDLSLFRIPRFTAASGSVTVAFFSLFGFIFLMTQYFQFIKHYGPLSAGVHLLPVATSVGIASVLGTKLAVRFGTKLVVACGLLMVAAFYGWVAVVIAPSTGYGTIAIQMVLYGIGMGFTSAPATEAIMGAVPNAKAGVGSAVNDATRLLGGTLGVAVIGSVFASLYASRLTSRLPAALPASLAHAAHASVGAALGVAGHLAQAGGASLGAGVQRAASGAFIDGLSAGCLVAGGVALAGALMAAVLLPAQPASVESGPTSLPATAPATAPAPAPASSPAPAPAGEPAPALAD